MFTKFQAGRARWKAFLARRSRIGRLSIRMLVLLTVAIILYDSHTFRILDVIFIIISSAILLPLLPILLYRWISRRVLWKVRNRLILTYLLMGLSPIVLFGTLGGIAAYLFTGQYATNTALTILDDAALRLKDETGTEAGFSLAQATSHSKPATIQHSGPFAASPSYVWIDDDDHWRTLISPTPESSTGQTTEQTIEPLLLPGEAPPAWLHAGFHGIVAAKGHLYLCAETHAQPGEDSTLVVAGTAITVKELSKMAKGLGTITLMGGFTHMDNDADADEIAAEVNNNLNGVDKPPTPGKLTAPRIKPPSNPAVDLKQTVHRKHIASGYAKVTGGKLPLPAHFYDAPVIFTLPTDITSWQTGEKTQMVLMVQSRPTLLYAHLFSTSVGLGNFVRVVLIAITTVFVIIEILSLLMALSLSRTITRSVADLYRGTREIDAGHLDHRIRVAKYDQLGALASSFNGMAHSISQLLIQQSEKERLLNELKIAQEVQSTLFPISPAFLGGLEMHALNIPASTVGGDYYDFIFGSHSGLCLALGDISGKGISAALLMASLHSAVRAFSLGEEAAEHTQPSPAFLLKLLNRHLYLSTQSARYATLFLAFYDVKTHQLTYSNGGHLPPLLLSSDGKVRRLTCGGPVVGLLDDLEYEEETVQLEPGDLLLAFTDGLTEPENPAQNNAEFGEGRLLDLMQQHRDEPLPTLALNTLKTIQTWIGDHEQPDDMTILLARQL